MVTGKIRLTNLSRISSLYTSLRALKSSKTRLVKPYCNLDISYNASKGSILAPLQYISAPVCVIFIYELLRIVPSTFANFAHEGTFIMLM